MRLSQAWELLLVEEMPDGTGDWRQYRIAAAVTCADGSLRIVDTVVAAHPRDMEALRRSEGV